MARAKPTKNLSKRIDSGYIGRSHPMRSSRRALTWLAGAAALVWLIAVSVRVRGGKAQAFDRIHNPGPVSAAHANIQNDCRACHTGPGESTFTRGVTDAACLKCHDGAIHVGTQKLATNPTQLSRADRVLAIQDSTHPQGMRSADCVSCHVEHRDRVALAATSDAHCQICHADLNSAMAAGAAPQVKPRIVAFNIADHPAFGRRLRKDGKLTDPTKLQFNHKFHFEHTELKGSLESTNACQQCHRPSELDRRYMQPVNYTSHCQRCHELKLSPEIMLVHEDMSIVRAQLASLPTMLRQRLMSMPADQRQNELIEKVPASGRRKATTRPMDDNQWIAKQLAPVTSDVQATLDDEKSAAIAGHAELMRAVSAPTTQVSGVEVPISDAVEFHVAYGMTNKCAKCHTMNDGLSPGAISQKPGAPLLATLPTGILQGSPRRWFVASRFDHDAHRNIDCRSCHLGALTSELTSDILSPDIDTKTATGQSCADCHRTSTAASPAAPADCVTCHNFHDRARDRSFTFLPAR